MDINIGKKINSRRKELKISQGELASRLRLHGVNITNQAVSKWESGATLPNAQQFLILCTVLGFEDIMGEFCSVDSGDALSGLNAAGRKKALEYIELLRLSGLYSPAPAAAEPRLLPLYSIAVSAGTGQFLDASDYELTQVDDDVPSCANFGVRVAGDSMEPDFSDGQIVWVKQQPAVKDGELGIFLYDGSSYLKQLSLASGRAKLVSFNPHYDDIIISDGMGFKTLGKVVG